MSLDEQISDPDGGGQDAGSEVTEGTQPAAPAAPAARTYSDAEMASARRSFQAESQREWQRREAAIRAEFEQRFVAREQPKPTDPFAAFDPTVAGPLKTAFQQMLDAGIAPYKAQVEAFNQQREDLAFANDESKIAAKYPDYQKNRTAVLEFAVANNIPNPEAAFHAWRSMNQWDSEITRVANEQLRRKTAQATRTPSLEGRGGGAPTSKQTFKDKNGKLDRDAMDEAAKELFRAAESE